MSTTITVALARPALGVHFKPNANNSNSFKPASSPTRIYAFRRSIIKWRCRSTGTMAVVVKREKDEDEEEWAPEKLEVLAQLEPWAEAHVLPLLKSPEVAWQPSDLLPDPAALGEDGFHAACRELRARAAGVPDAHLVCLVGNMVTEEALPTYQCVPNRFEGVRDLTGADATAWARWIRGWSAEENRHGGALGRYLYLSGRVDMRRVDATVHRLIAAGMDAMGGAAEARSPYQGFL